jgi:hypothetical protein
VGSLLGITLVQQMLYRGDANEEWSNTYHFRDAPPSSDSAWLTAVTSLATQVKTVVPTTGHIVRAYGYDSDDDHAHAVYSKDWLAEAAPIAGTYSTFGTDFPLAGDQAYFIWWRTDRRNSRGKYIYLRKYLHDGFCDFADPDKPGPGYKTACVALAAELDPAGGALLGGLRSRTHEDLITAHGGSEYVTTRTQHRRGKRPLASP